MLFKVQRLQQIEDLLLEADLIRTGDQLSDFGKEANDKNSSEETSEEEEAYRKLDVLIDALLDKGIIDLTKELAKPIYEKEFGLGKGLQITKRYLKYCKKNLAEISERMKKIISSDIIDSSTLEQLSMTRIQIAARIEALTKIYQAFKKITHAELNRAADEVLVEIEEIKKDFSDQQASTVSTFGQLMAPPLKVLSNSKSDEKKKEDSAEDVITKLIALEKILPFYSEEAKKGAESAKAKIEETVRNSVGDEKFEEIKRIIINNDEEAKVLRRILSLKHMNFKNEEEIYREIDQIKMSINKLNARLEGRPPSRPEVIEYLNKVLAEEAAALFERAKDKSISLENAKGIHYSFNTKLKLHEIVDLPVTGKQIADANIIMRFRKRFTNILSLFPAGESTMTAAGQAFANLGKQTHKAYAVALNSTGKWIGRLIKGREGELKGDAYTRLLIPDTGVLDKVKPVMEEGSAPGLAIQVPGSVGGMGPIVAPTQNTFGSGDNFNARRRKKPKLKLKKAKKKHKSIYEEKMEILNFANFLKNTSSKNEF